MGIARSDTFARANVAIGFGVATSGATWTVQAGDGQSVASNEGVITGSSASTFATLGLSLPGADGEGLVRFAVSDTTNTAGLFLRWTDPNNYYLARYDGAGGLAFFKNVGGTKTTVGSAAFAPTLGAFYWLRFRVSGTAISLRVWADGTSEPGSWNYTTADTSLSGVGGNANFVGLYGFSNGSPNNYDSFSVDDLAATTHALGVVAHARFVTRRALVAPSRSTFRVKSNLKSLGAVAHARLKVAAKLQGQARSGFRVNAPIPRVGVSALAVSTKTQTWVDGGSGTETDFRSTDVTGKGWQAGRLSGYGAMPLATWYPIDNDAEGVEQTSLQTTHADGSVNPDGWQHWLSQSPSANFTGSEDVLWTPTDLAPTGTDFRAYFQATGAAPDANGFTWQAWACLYPGDPGYLALRFDLHNPTGSAISLAATDSLEVALIGGLQQSDGTWSAANGGYGTLAGGNTVGWPGDGAGGGGAAVDPDYVYITPTSGKASDIGVVAVKRTSLASLGWSSPILQYLVNSTRLKLKVMGNIASVAAGATQTIRTVLVLRRNLTATDARAIAADLLTTGTPTTTAGSYTTYAPDERAYVYAAAAGGAALTTTLDLTGVSVRYKPILKITGWTPTAPPTLTWGGSALTAGVDYRWTTDAAAHVLYIQLYYDIVASGATAGQRNNAALAIQGIHTLVSAARATFAVAASAGAAPAVPPIQPYRGGVVTFAQAVSAADAQWRAGVDLLASDELTPLEDGSVYDLAAPDRLLPGSASVALDTTQTVLRTLTLALRSSDGRYLPGASGYPSGGAGSPAATGLTWFNVRYRPWLDLATGFNADASRIWTRTYLGIFVLTQPSVQVSVTGAVVQLTLADKTALLQKPYRLTASNLPTYTASGGHTAAGYAAGSLVDAAMLDLAVRGGVPAARLHFEPTTATLPGDYAVVEGDEPWTHLTTLAATLGHVLYFDAQGALVRRANPLALNTPPVWTFTPGPLCTVASASRQTDFTNTFNHIIVNGGSSATALVRGEATVTNAASPYHAQEIGDRVTFWGQNGLGDMTPDPTIGTTAQAQAQAQLLLAQHLGQQERVQLSGRPLPTLAPYDRITVQMPQAGLMTDAQLTQLTIPLDTSASSGMSLTAAKWLMVGS